MALEGGLDLLIRFRQYPNDRHSQLSRSIGWASMAVEKAGYGCMNRHIGMKQAALGEGLDKITMGVPVIIPTGAMNTGRTKGARLPLLAP